MAVPKRKKSVSRVKMGRRSNSKKIYPPISKCKNCNSFKRPHHICGQCGVYRDMVVITQQS